MPRRTYGRLKAGQDGTLLFHYRRLLLGPEKKVVIGKASSFEVGQGVFFPSVVEPIESAGRYRLVFRLLPTYRGAEESVCSCLELARVRDVRLTKGIRSFWKFAMEDGGEASSPSAAGTPNTNKAA